MASDEAPSVTVEPTADGLRVARPPLPEAGEESGGATGVDEYAPRRRTPEWFTRPLARLGVAYALLLALAGAVAGLVWNWAVDLPSYVVASDGTMGAATSERGLAAFFGTDAWFTLLGALVGLFAGLCAWRWFRRLGWPVVVVAVAGALLACGACWGIGRLLGPHDFADRLQAAAPGAHVPIDFHLRSRVAVLVWPLFAVLPVTVASWLGLDDEAAAGAHDRSDQAPGEGVEAAGAETRPRSAGPVHPSAPAIQTNSGA